MIEHVVGYKGARRLKLDSGPILNRSKCIWIRRGLYGVEGTVKPSLKLKLR